MLSIHENGTFDVVPGKNKWAFFYEEKFFSVLLKTEESKSAIEEWYYDEFADENENSLNSIAQSLQLLIADNPLFEVNRDSNIAYSELLANKQEGMFGRKIFENTAPLKPNRSFDLLKKWYFIALELDFAKFSKPLADIDLISAKGLRERDFINILIKEIDKKYFSPIPTNLSEAAKPFFIPNEIEKNQNELFRNWLNERLATFNSEKINSIDVKSKESVEFLKVNDFNKVPCGLVELYFMQLTELGKLGEPFLSAEDVIKFVQKAFCNIGEDVKLTFKFKKGEQHLIWKLFYNFFLECTTDARYDSTRLLKEKYVKLISSHFTNWEYQTIFNNFSKSGAKKWKSLKDLNS